MTSFSTTTMCLDIRRRDRGLAGDLFGRERDGEREGAAASTPALHPDAAPLELDEMPRQREPQSCAFGLPGRVPTLERREDALVLSRGEAGAVVGHRDGDVVLAPIDANVYLSAVRTELDRVSDEVEEDLSKACRVRNDDAPVRLDHAQPQVLLIRKRTDDDEHFLHDSSEVGVLEVDLDLAGLDPGQVEDVVDQRE